jgi:hypothetical protein
MIDAAGDLNAVSFGHVLIPLQNRQLVLPTILRDQKPGLVSGSSSPQIAHNFALRSFIRHPSVPAERQIASLPVLSVSDAGQALGYSRDGSER